MSAMRDESEIQNYLDLEEKKRNVLLMKKRLATKKYEFKQPLTVKTPTKKNTQQHVQSCFKKGLTSKQKLKLC